jgi:hypothetical protein
VLRQKLKVGTYSDGGVRAGRKFHLRRLDFTEHHLHAPQQRAEPFSREHAFARAGKEAAAERNLQVFQHLTDRRLGKVELLRRFAHRAVLNEHFEEAQMA